LKNFVCDFIEKSIKIIENNLKLYDSNNNNISLIEVVCKCLELISIIFKTLPNDIINKFNESNLIDIIFQLIDLHEVNINNYLFNLIGEFTYFQKSDLLNKHIEKLIFFLKLYLTSKENFPDLTTKKELNDNRNYICSYSNCCWAIGSLSLNFGKEIGGIIDPVMVIYIKFLSYPKVKYLIKFF
jgi:hypothetical protein